MRAATVLLWDIDGTLLTTGRAGIFALEAAVHEVCGVELRLQELLTAGLTDAEVAELAIRASGGEPRPELLDEFLRCYERHLPECLHRRRGHVMPGVVAVLDDLARRRDAVSLLLTGNTAAGARAKLVHYGLDRYFPGPGAFCEGPGGRSAIAGRARELARGHLGSNGDGAVYVIGDTPADVRCGNEIGARAVAVASGSHSAQELAAEEPFLVLEQIPPPDAFRSLLRLG